MISLVTKAASEAKQRSSKRVLAAHLKNAVLKEPDKFDFLNDIVGKVADAPAAGSKHKKDADDSDESPVEGVRKRRPAAAGGRGRRKKEGSEE
jgi:Dr1-associated corepressor